MCGHATRFRVASWTSLLFSLLVPLVCSVSMCRVGVVGQKGVRFVEVRAAASKPRRTGRDVNPGLALQNRVRAV